MKIFTLRLIAVFLFVFSFQGHAETLAQYVNSCKSELGFTTIPDNLNCYDGILFDRGSGQDPIRDYVGYAKINDAVDLAFACRWLGGSKEKNPGKAISLELMIHNRQNGKTCFFAAKDSDDASIVSPAIISPTNSQASTYWKTPTQVNDGDKCVNCHVAGPYIASPKIAHALATFGLLNNGHDTIVDPNNPAHYKVVGAGNNNSAFYSWDTLIDTFIERPSASNPMCSESCHSIGSYSTTPTVRRNAGGNFPLLKSISEVIANMGTNMPPTAADNDYRWINRNANTSTGSAEYFAEAKNDYPGLLSGCGLPTKLEAHAVGNPYSFSSSDSFPDTLAYFNLREGLKCINSKQKNGNCNDYEVRYLCNDDAFGGTRWTDWWNTDSPNATGDHEGRHRIPDLCSNPHAIQARTVVNGVTYSAYGPNDRIAVLTPTSIVCNDADQPNQAKCGNYVARYSNCVSAPASYNIRLTNVWSGRVLTATGEQNNAETRAQPLNASWKSQTWIVQAVEGGAPAVRLKNVGVTKFLNSETNAENSKVLTYELHADWAGEQWLIESISGSSQVRIKNVWTGKYLTVTDTSDYSAITLKTLNTGWTSQRWTLQKL